MTDTAKCPCWDSLLPELRARIVSMLPPNEVTCTFRLINKAMAKECIGLIAVRLSQPVPHHAFVRRWGDERGAHGLALTQRQQLLCLTARSGVVANLEVAVAAMGCGLPQKVFIAAAEGGHVVVCAWLLDRGSPSDVREVIRCAARGGHAAVVRRLLAQSPERSPELAREALLSAAGSGQRALCEEMLAAGAGADPTSIENAAYEAAEGGHVDLTEWLLGQLGQPGDVSDGELLRCAARGGFELSALQRLYHSQLGSSEASALADCGAEFAAAALASPTPDWRANLEWLEAARCRLVEEQSWDAISNTISRQQGDVMERVTMLRERGLLNASHCLEFAVSTNNLSVVRYLRSEGLLTRDFGMVGRAMEVGNVEILAELLAAGGRIGPSDVNLAARRGHLHVLHWLAETAAAVALQEALQEGGKLAEDGARSGSLELMEWLWERGCPSDEERVFTAAAGAGNTALLERLVARGCPMSCDAYLEAGYNGDLATLRCLRELDCPWGPDCTTFNRAVCRFGQCCSLAALRCLVAEGCPVDWQSARVQARCGGAGADVMAWIESHLPQA